MAASANIAAKAKKKEADTAPPVNLPSVVDKDAVVENVAASDDHAASSEHKDHTIFEEKSTDKNTSDESGNVSKNDPVIAADGACTGTKETDRDEVNNNDEDKDDKDDKEDGDDNKGNGEGNNSRVSLNGKVIYKIALSIRTLSEIRSV